MKEKRLDEALKIFDKVHPITFAKSIPVDKGRASIASKCFEHCTHWESVHSPLNKEQRCTAISC